jgi:4-hydroxy-tetrahydrodipicolinate synthase
MLFKKFPPEYLSKINNVLFLDVNPICVKYILNQFGFKVGKPRLPLTEPTTETKKQIKEVIKFYEN